MKPYQPTSAGNANDFLYRAATIAFRCRAQNLFADQVMTEHRGDTITPLLLRGTVSPTALLNSPLAVTVVAESAAKLTKSAAASLRALGMIVRFKRAAAVMVPGRIITPSGGFGGEGSVIKVAQGDTGGNIILSPHKFSVISVFSNELAEQSDIEIIVKHQLSDAWGLAYDASVFHSNASIEGIAPAGIFFEVVPLAATVGGGFGAMTGDIKKLMAALVAAGAGSNPVFVGSPEMVASLKVLAGPRFDYPVLASLALAPGSIAVIEAGSFVSGFNPIPEFESSDAATLHMEDTIPLPLVDGAAVAASPVRSLWQTNCTAIKMHLRLSFGMRAAGHCQLIAGATW